jgi:hypothetical protein
MAKLERVDAKGKFRMGQLVMTRGVSDRVADDVEFAEFVSRSLTRHLKGDWGDMCPEDKAANNQALIHGGRLFSAYEKDSLPRIWIISEADRRATTILFPEEY